VSDAVIAVDVGVGKLSNVLADKIQHWVAN